MTRPSFYNTNLNRKYPFVVGSTGDLLDRVIVDFGCYMSAESGFIEGVHSVFLNSIRRAGDQLEFEFTTDAPGLAGKSLIFYRNADDPMFTTSYSELITSVGPAETLVRLITAAGYVSPEAAISSAMSSSLSSSNNSSEHSPLEFCHVDIPWEGFLVTGDLATALHQISADECVPYYSVVSEEERDVDLLLLCDNTGSMIRDIEAAQALVVHLVRQLGIILPNFNIRWAVASYGDYIDRKVDYQSYPFQYPKGYKKHCEFTDDPDTVVAAVDEWFADSGGDWPEMQLLALKRIAEDWYSEFGGDDSRVRMIMWTGDAPGWENGAKGKPYPALTETIAALVNADIAVFAAASGDEGYGIDGIGHAALPGGPIDGRRQASTIAEETGGKLFTRSSWQTISVISDSILSALAIATEVILINPCRGISSLPRVEPSRIQNRDGSYVRTMNVANADRTRAANPSQCRDLCWPFQLQDHYIACECLFGDIRFKEGYNACIAQDPATNAIIINAGIGCGEGEPCDTDVPLFPGEAAEAHLDGALRCDEVIRMINGIGQRYFQITGGLGVVVTPVPAEHKIVVDVNMHNMALCPSYPVEGSIGSPSYSDDLCDCGPVE